MNEISPEMAYQQGRRAGLAIAAVAAACVAFVSLLGLEKAVLAIVLAILARRGMDVDGRAGRLTTVAIGIALVYILTFATVLILYHARIAELIRLLQQMG